MGKQDRKCILCNVQFTPKESNEMCFTCNLTDVNKKNIQHLAPRLEKGRVLGEINEGIVSIGEIDDSVNIFHDFTETEMKLSQKKIRVHILISDFVEYVISWCEVNSQMSSPKTYNLLFDEICNLQIFEISKSELISLFNPFFYFQNGILSAVPEVVFNDENRKGKVKDNFIEYILSQNIFLNNEQFTKGSILKLMTSQLYFLKEQQKNARISNNNVDNVGVFSELLKLINKLMVSNDLILSDLKLINEKQNSLLTKQSETLMEQVKDFAELHRTIDELIESVKLIGKKKKGWFNS